MITTDNITSHELIGLDVELVESTNPEIIGLEGTVFDETRSMLRINTQRGPKSVAKSGNTWKFSIPGGDAVVDGSRIAKRSFDRIGGKS